MCQEERESHWKMEDKGETGREGVRRAWSGREVRGGEEEGEKEGAAANAA